MQNTKKSIVQLLNLPRPICIVGMAKSGRAALHFLLNMGIPRSDIITYDQSPDKGLADFHDYHDLLRKSSPQTYLISPGVPLYSPWLQEAQQSGALLTSDMNIAAQLMTSEKIIGVTGSLGKSTTTSLIGEACKVIDPSCFIGGNLGLPILDYFNDLMLGKRKKAQWIVLELSSFQLENAQQLPLEYSLLTYLSPNHLERYDSLQDYYKTKLKIADMTKQKLYVNSHGGDAAPYVQANPGKCEIQLIDKINIHHFDWASARLLGAYNQDNIAMALAIARELQWGTEAEKAIQNFAGLPHRLENLGIKNGVLYINDSKATTIESVLSAVKTITDYVQSPQKIYLLLGGKDKGLPWTNLAEIKNRKNIHPIFFGQCGELIKKSIDFTMPYPYYSKLEGALSAAISLAQPGDCVLLSPGGTSLDEFSGFEARGDFFKSLLST